MKQQSCFLEKTNEKNLMINTNSSINNRLYTHYKKTICYDLLLKQNIGSLLEIIQLEKIILNTTSKIIVSDKKNIIPGLIALQLVSGQHQKITSAHKSIAGFKLRENQVIGCKVSLRGEKMFNFLEKLITIILPRIRQFSLISFNNFDGKGNLSLGLSPILIAPELESSFEYFESLGGINISLCTSSSKSSIKSAKQTSTIKLDLCLPKPELLQKGIKNENAFFNNSTTFTENLGYNKLKSVKRVYDEKAALLFTGFQLPIANNCSVS